MTPVQFIAHSVMIVLLGTGGLHNPPPNGEERGSMVWPPRADQIRDPEAHAKQFDALSAQEVLELMARSHRAFDTIFVTGTQTTVHGQGRPQSRIFDIAYERPSRFRFNHQKNRRDQEGRYLLHFDKEEIRMLTSGTVTHVPWEGPLNDPILSILYGMESVFDLNYSIPYVPYLLLREDALSQRAMTFENLERLSNENKGSIPCMRLRATLSGSRERTVTIWLSTASLAIERTVEELVIDDLPYVITTEHHPVTNKWLHERDLFWDPPQDAPRRTLEMQKDEKEEREEREE